MYVYILYITVSHRLLTLFYSLQIHMAYASIESNYPGTLSITPWLKDIYICDVSGLAVTHSVTLVVMTSRITPLERRDTSPSLI